MTFRIRFINTSKIFQVFALTVLAICSPILRSPARAMGMGNTGEFASFVSNVTNGNANELRGVYVPNVLALPIVQQPSGYAAYVSDKDEVLTQFGLAAELGNVGLLAHNHLAGKYFNGLKQGDMVFLVYGDGRVEGFLVAQVLKFQALSPNSPYSEFKNMQTQVTSTAEQLFKQVYRGERHITFQTCIAANGSSSWGRLFVIAEPADISPDLGAKYGSLASSDQ